MNNEQSQCKYTDPISRQDCDNWYPYDGQRFCPYHRGITHIPRTVSVIPEPEINTLNAKVAECLQMSIPDLVIHIRNIEEQIRSLERDRRAATLAKRNLESNLSEEERAVSRAESVDYKPRERSSRNHTPKKSPEEKAANRKEGFSKWAARLGVKVETLQLMDEDELFSKIAKYKAAQK